MSFRTFMLGFIALELIVLAALYIGAEAIQEKPETPVYEAEVGTFSNLPMPETPYVTPIPSLPAAAANKADMAPDIKWEPLVRSAEMNVDLDPTSIITRSMPGGFEVESLFRMTFGQPIDVAGKKEKGAYYINKMSVLCKDKTMRVEESTVYTKEHRKLATGKNLGILKNQNDPNTFVTVWAYMACEGVKDKKLGRSA